MGLNQLRFAHAAGYLALIATAIPVGAIMKPLEQSPDRYISSYKDLYPCLVAGGDRCSGAYPHDD